MGTRLKPGRFDCHAAALDDEPVFTLLARDPLAGFLVSIWSSVRNGDFEAADVKFTSMCAHVGRPYCADPDVEKASEALDCALAMFAWRENNGGRWREPRELTPDPVVKALGVAVMALRSYQYGNSAPDLAADIANAAEIALQAAGYESALIAAGVS